MKRFLFISLCCIAFIGCDQKPAERHYAEVVIEAPMPNPSAMMGDPHAGLGLDIPMVNSTTRVQSDLTWDVPSGWQEVAGSGMRIATFKRADNPDAIDVSIVTLSGPAGGLEANLTRWAGQISLDLTANDGLSKLIDSAQVLKTQGGLELKIFDFTQLQKGLGPSEKSTVAAMVEINGSTVFVKMTGTVKTVTDNLESFKTLSRSVRPK